MQSNSAVSTSLGKVEWYARRLKTMGAGELLWRAGRLARNWRLSLVDVDKMMGCHNAEEWQASLDTFRSRDDRPFLLSESIARRLANRAPDVATELIHAAQAAADLNFQFFGYPATRLPEPVDWNYDPIRDVRWPKIRADRLNHRVAGDGDVKWIWELNRLQHVPLLAQAHLLTGDSFFSCTAFEHLDSWIHQNPPNIGIAWRGAFEAGIRAISITAALQGLRNSPDLSVDRYRRLVGLLAQSASMCWQQRSRFSSANNHLIGEMAGLAVIAIAFPDLSESSRWERLAVGVLSTEAQRQILPDGVGAEQAIAYQVFTSELLHIVATMLTIRDRTVPTAITDAIARSGRFLTDLVGSEDPAPRFGDDDEGFALRLGPAPVRTVRDHLGIISTSAWGAFAVDAATESADGLWFEALAAENPTLAVGGKADAPVPSRSSFFARDGGLVVLRSENRRLTMDVGPLGYLSIAAHGHADALAVTLSASGMYLIGDPGTGSYYGHPSWRTAMRSTRAHATISIDDLDQSISGGPFLWTRHANVRVRRVDTSAGVIDAEHDGYSHLGVTHRRWLVDLPDGKATLIVDLISGAGEHKIRSSWPLHPSLDASPRPDGWAIYHADLQSLALHHAATVPFAHDDVRGDSERDLGWWCPRLESRDPAWWLSAVCTAPLPVAFCSLLTLNGEATITSISIELLDKRRIRVKWQESGSEHLVTIDADGAGVVSTSISDVMGRDGK